MNVQKLPTITKQDAPRRGFTIIEILIVIAIIGVLMGLIGAVVAGMVANAREKATKTTLTKIDGLLEQRLRGIDQFMTKEERRKIYNFNTPAKKAEAVKREMRAQFPVNFDEAPQLRDRMVNDPDLNVQIGNHTRNTESSEILYYLLTKTNVLGVPAISADDFLSSEVGDTDQDGLNEFIDNWGRPLVYYRWPTRLVRPDDDDDMTDPNPLRRDIAGLLIPGVPDTALGQDPDDALGDFADTPAFNEQDFHTPGTYHTLLIVSAGPDGELGLYEPWQTSNFGHLAQPLPAIVALPPEEVGDSVLADNQTNRQQAR